MNRDPKPGRSDADLASDARANDAVAGDWGEPVLEHSKRMEIARTCTYFHTRRATRILGDRFDEALRPYGLKGTQFSLLVAISLIEEPTVGRMADILAADRTTLTRTLAPLERDGLIASQPGEDRRERRLQLTRKGAELLRDASEAWEETQRSIVEGMGKDDWQRLMTGLAAVRGLSTSD